MTSSSSSAIEGAWGVYHSGVESSVSTAVSAKPKDNEQMYIEPRKQRSTRRGARPTPASPRFKYLDPDVAVSPDDAETTGTQMRIRPPARSQWASKPAKQATDPGPIVVRSSTGDSHAVREGSADQSVERAIAGAVDKVVAAAAGIAARSGSVFAPPCTHVLEETSHEQSHRRHHRHHHHQRSRSAGVGGTGIDRLVPLCRAEGCSEQVYSGLASLSLQYCSAHRHLATSSRRELNRSVSNTNPSALPPPFLAESVPVQPAGLLGYPDVTPPVSRGAARTSVFHPARPTAGLSPLNLAPAVPVQSPTGHHHHSFEPEGPITSPGGAALECLIPYHHDYEEEPQTHLHSHRPSRSFRASHAARQTTPGMRSDFNTLTTATDYALDDIRHYSEQRRGFRAVPNVELVEMQGSLVVGTIPEPSPIREDVARITIHDGVWHRLDSGEWIPSNGEDPHEVLSTPSVQSLLATTRLFVKKLDCPPNETESLGHGLFFHDPNARSMQRHEITGSKVPATVVGYYRDQEGHPVFISRLPKSTVVPEVDLKEYTHRVSACAVATPWHSSNEVDVETLPTAVQRVLQRATSGVEVGKSTKPAVQFTSSPPMEVPEAVPTRSKKQNQEQLIASGTLSPVPPQKKPGFFKRIFKRSGSAPVRRAAPVQTMPSGIEAIDAHHPPPVAPARNGTHRVDPFTADHTPVTLAARTDEYVEREREPYYNPYANDPHEQYSHRNYAQRDDYEYRPPSDAEVVWEPYDEHPPCGEGPAEVREQPRSTYSVDPFDVPPPYTARPRQSIQKKHKKRRSPSPVPSSSSSSSSSSSNRSRSSSTSSSESSSSSGWRRASSPSSPSRSSPSRRSRAERESTATSPFTATASSPDYSAPPSESQAYSRSGTGYAPYVPPVPQLPGDPLHRKPPPHLYS